MTDRRRSVTPLVAMRGDFAVRAIRAHRTAAEKETALPLEHLLDVVALAEARRGEQNDQRQVALRERLEEGAEFAVTSDDYGTFHGDLRIL